VTFHRPIRVGEPCTVTGRITRSEGRELWAEAEIRDARGRLCVSATGSYRALTRRQAESVTGSSSRQIDGFVAARTDGDP
jgi:acyl-CoA thioesterase FadM